MKTVTPTQLRSNIYQYLDEVLATGVPLEIRKGQRLLHIVPVEPVNRMAALPYRPETIMGDPDELVNISWEEEIRLDLP